ncbi:MAG TPA: monovalent cation/H(+) antiporter subunit G [Sphingomonadales bacterium]
MIHADLPAWALVIVGLFLLVGSALTLIGCLGLLHLDTFYKRVHAPTLGTTLGGGLVLLASMLYFSVEGSRFVAHEIVIAVCMIVTTPITFLTLMQAVRHRERTAQGADAPPPAVARKASEKQDSA